MKKSLRRLLLIGLCAYLLFLIASFPASTALGWFAPAQLQASAVEGTVWNGHAAAISLEPLKFGETRWRFRPGALLSGALGWQLSARRPDGFVEGIFAVAPTGRLRIDELRGALPLAAAGALLPQPRPGGELSVELDGVRVRNGWPERLEGTVNVARLVYNNEPLGSFRIDLSGADGRIEGRIRSIDGPLETEGTLIVTPDRNYELRAALRARPESSQRLLDGLRILPNDNNGRRLFSLAGSL